MVNFRKCVLYTPPKEISNYGQLQQCSKPSSHQKQTVLPSPPLIPFFTCSWMHKRHAESIFHVPEQDRTAWILLNQSCTLRPSFIQCSVRKVISKHIHLGFETVWLLLALIECTQKESDFSVIKVSSLYFPWHVSPGQMATTCHRPKKGQHSSRAVVVNIYHGSLKKDRENNLKLISVWHVNVVQGKASLDVWVCVNFCCDTLWGDLKWHKKIPLGRTMSNTSYPHCPTLLSTY